MGTGLLGIRVLLKGTVEKIFVGKKVETRRGGIRAGGLIFLDVDPRWTGRM
jgi:hypothetical protein